MKITVQWISPNLAVIGAKIWSNFESITLHDYTSKKIANYDNKTNHTQNLQEIWLREHTMEKKDKLNN